MAPRWEAFTQEAFTNRSFHTQKPLPTASYTEKLLRKKAFAHRSCNTQKLSHTGTFTHRRYSVPHCQKLRLQNGSRHQSKKGDVEAFSKRDFTRNFSSAKIEMACCQTAIAIWTQPFHYNLRCQAARDHSVTHAAAAPSNLDAAMTVRSAETELQSAKELRTADLPHVPKHIFVRQNSAFCASAFFK